MFSCIEHYILFFSKVTFHVCLKNDISIFTGQQMTVISKGDFTAVIHHQDRYYAANRDTTTIDTFEYADHLKRIDSFTINAMDGSFITLGISNYLIYVCSLEDHRIDAYTLSGDLQFTIGKYGREAPGELFWPRICDTDASGAALIADCWNDRMQVLGVSGQWNIVQLDPSLKKPYSTCLVNDILYVYHKNEHGTNIISSYKSE